MLAPNRFQRKRLIPYRVLVTMLYGASTGLQRDGSGVVRVKSGQLSRELRIPISRLLDCFKYLSANQLIRKWEKIGNGLYLIRLVEPRVFDKKEGNDE